MVGCIGIDKLIIFLKISYLEPELSIATLLICASSAGIIDILSGKPSKS